MVPVVVSADPSSDVEGRSVGLRPTEDKSDSEGGAGTGDCGRSRVVAVELCSDLFGLLGLTGLGVETGVVAVKGRADAGTSDVAT